MFGGNTDQLEWSLGDGEDVDKGLQDTGPALGVCRIGGLFRADLEDPENQRGPGSRRWVGLGSV